MLEILKRLLSRAPFLGSRAKVSMGMRFEIRTREEVERELKRKGGG